MQKPKGQNKSNSSAENKQKNLVGDVTVPNQGEKQFRLDELSEKQLEIFSQNSWLVNLIEKGCSISEALKRLDLNRCERSVRDLFNRYKKQGRLGLVDKRWLRTNEAKVLTPATKKIIVYYFFSYPAAGARLVWKATCESCQEQKLPQPSESSIKKFLESLPEPFKMLRHGKKGIRQWEHEAAPVVRYENTTYSNERWQGDHTELPTWVRIKDGNDWKVARAFLSGFIDAHSRSIPGFIVSTKYPDSWTIALLFRFAISLKKRKGWKNRGLPTVFQSDRGKDFLSKAIAATLINLVISFDPDPPYYPNRKGKMERFFLTLDIGCLRILPGHIKDIGVSESAAMKRVHELLTLNQLNSEIERFIVEDYHQHIHSETGQKPIESWEETVRLRLPTSEDDLNLLVLKEDVEKTVKNTGILFVYKSQKHLFWCPELIYHYRRRIKLGYNPEDLESVLVYCAATGEFLCEAFNMRSENPRYDINDVRSTRSQFRKGMIDRIREYVEEVEIEDRRVLRQTEWKEIRSECEEGGAEQDQKQDEADEEIMSLLENLRKLDRGEE